MALPVLDAVFASSADLPRTQLLSKWLTEQLGSGSIADFSTLPERYLYAKIAVSLGGPRTEQEYIELPKSYAWSDIYGAIIFNRTAPAAPSSLTLTPLTSSSIRLNWVTNGASVAYSVERSVDGSAFQVIGTTAIGATTATNTGLSIASNYQYRIRGSSGGFFTGYSNTASASTYDANASSFIATSGATDIVAINDFVLGVKTLGLWNSMVCWPLRSTQNAATGNTMFSLGGLGTFNATMFNSPVRGENGLTNSATGDMRTNLILAGGPQAHISVSNSTTASVTRSFGGTLSTSNTKGIRFRDDAILWGDGALQFVGRDFTSAGQHKMAAALYNRPNTLRSFLNTTQATAGFGSAVVSGENTLTMMSARDNAVSTQFYSGVFTFYAAISAELSEAQYLSFYTLYKQTLGQGLESAMSYELKWGEKEAIGRIAAAARGDEGDPALVATYINWPWRYQVAAIINNFYAPTYLAASGGGIWKLTVDSDGTVTTELMGSGSGVASVLVKSPNSSVFSLTVDNSGILTVAPSGLSTTRQWISYLSGSNIFLIKVDNSGILTTEKQ